MAVVHAVALAALARLGVREVVDQLDGPAVRDMGSRQINACTAVLSCTGHEWRVAVHVCVRVSCPINALDDIPRHAAHKVEQVVGVEHHAACVCESKQTEGPARQVELAKGETQDSHGDMTATLAAA